MRIKHILFIVAFLVPLALLAACLFVLPSKDFSQNENRPLAQMPSTSLQEIVDGEYQEGFESYIGDQVLLRETGLGVSTEAQKLIGKKDINGVYLGKDHYYFNKFTEDQYSRTHITNQ